MTQTPQPSEAPETAEPRPEGEAPAKTFQPILVAPPPTKPSRKPLILLGVAVVLIVGGLLFWRSGPDASEAQAPVLDVANMTADALAENASPAAARELARRMVSGTMPEHAAAASAISRSQSPRLSRNLAMAMAAEHQKKQLEMVRQLEINRRMAEGGPYAE